MEIKKYQPIWVSKPVVCSNTFWRCCCLFFVLNIIFEVYNNNTTHIMFYLVKKLKTKVVFSPYDMDKLARSDEVMNRVRERVEGRCHSDYGYIIQIADVPSYGKDFSKHYLISVPEVT